MNPDPEHRALKLLLAADVHRQADKAQRPGAVYRSAEELVLDAGRRWPWRPLSRDWSPASRWGAPSLCFANTLIACMVHRDLRYVEGFAYIGQSPIHHAWNVDERGVVHDFTWREMALLPVPGRAYHGVVVPIERAFDAVWTQGETVLIDPPQFHALMESWPRDDHPPRPTDAAIAAMLKSQIRELGYDYAEVAKRMGIGP